MIAAGGVLKVETVKYLSTGRQDFVSYRQAGLEEGNVLIDRFSTSMMRIFMP